MRVFPQEGSNGEFNMGSTWVQLLPVRPRSPPPPCSGCRGSWRPPPVSPCNDPSSCSHVNVQSCAVRPSRLRMCSAPPGRLLACWRAPHPCKGDTLGTPPAPGIEPIAGLNNVPFSDGLVRMRHASDLTTTERLAKGGYLSGSGGIMRRVSSQLLEIRLTKDVGPQKLGDAHRSAQRQRRRNLGSGIKLKVLETPLPVHPR